MTKAHMPLFLVSRTQVAKELMILFVNLIMTKFLFRIVGLFIFTTDIAQNSLLAEMAMQYIPIKFIYAFSKSTFKMISK
jgi:hypothetical protein